MDAAVETTDVAAQSGSEWSRTDSFAVAAIAVAAFLAAAWYVPAYRASGGTPFFYQYEFGPAVMQACGKGFANPDGRTLAAMQPFLDQRADRFRCDQLPASIELRPLNPFQSFSRYLLMTVAGVWRLSSVTWAVVDLLTAGFYSVSLSAAYAALRFGFRRWGALAITLLWATSPWHLQNLPHLRDYSKVPFFVLALVASAFVFTERRPRDLLVVGAAFGAVQGFGYGMRLDAGLNFIPFFVALFGGTRDLLRGWKPKVACAALAMATFVLAARPILSTYNDAGSVWHVTLLGLTTPYDVNLNLKEPPPPYNFGYMYNDQYEETIIRSYWARLHPDDGPFQLSTHMYGIAGRAYYRALAAVFPGDILTRMVAAAVNVTNLPFLQGHGRVPIGITNRTLATLFEIRGAFVALLERCGPLLMIAALVAIGLESLRYACLAFFVFGAWAAYPALQYQFRHVFHFELVIFAAIGAACSIARRWVVAPRRGGGEGRERTKTALQSLVTVGGLLAATAAVVLAARAVQVPRVRALLDSYAVAPVEAVPTAPQEAGEGRTRLAASVLQGLPPSADVATAMVVAQFEPERCVHSSPIVATFRYDDTHSGSFSYDFSTQVRVPFVAGSPVPTRVFMPVYAVYKGLSPMSRFVGLEVATADVPCVSLGRVRNLDRLPILLPVTLTDRWTEARAYQQLDAQTAVPPSVWRVFARWWPSVVRRLPGYRAA